MHLTTLFHRRAATDAVSSSVRLCADNSLINSVLDVFQRQSAVSVLQFRFSLLTCRDCLVALPGRGGGEEGGVRTDSV